ncbi:hypothetical protein MMC13_003389 [Lambiella insularis]|nr:hypothetical protein [Lambiella insularis]
MSPCLHKKIDTDPIVSGLSTPLEPPSDKPSRIVTDGQKMDKERSNSKQAYQERTSHTGLEDIPQQQWNHPRINVWRTVIACYGLFIMGMNDATYGVCIYPVITRAVLTSAQAIIPYLEIYYHVSYTVVSLIFLSPLVGYTCSALLNNRIHMVLGQLGIAYIAPGVRLVAYIVISQHPPFPVLVLVFILAGFGNGLEDAAWNAWIGNMQNANEVMGFLHGAYGLGGTLAPLIATAMITEWHLEWYKFYYIMIGISFTELWAAVIVFWEATGKRFRNDHARTSDKEGSRTKEALSSRVVWICAVFLLIYVGIEVAVGGWVVSFMGTVRGSTPFAAGMAETGFWLGITIGRLVLGFVTGRIGEKLAVMIYLALATGLHLIFYLVPNQYVSFVAVALEGFFLAPLFPAAVIAATKLLPPYLHVGGIGFAAAFGAAGACIFPFIVGAIAQAKGVQVLMPIVLAMLVADAAVWALLPSLKKADVVVTADGEANKAQ